MEINQELCLHYGKMIDCSKIKYHMTNVHENDKTVKCLDCDLTFASNRKMLNHRRVHNAKSYQCNEVNCQYFTSNKANLARQ